MFTFENINNQIKKGKKKERSSFIIYNTHFNKTFVKLSILVLPLFFWKCHFIENMLFSNFNVDYIWKENFEVVLIVALVKKFPTMYWLINTHKFRLLIVGASKWQEITTPLIANKTDIWIGKKMLF